MYKDCYLVTHCKIIFTAFNQRRRVKLKLNTVPTLNLPKRPLDTIETEKEKQKKLSRTDRAKRRLLRFEDKRYSFFKIVQ